MKARSSDKGIERLLASAGILYFSKPELGNPYRTEADWRERFGEYLGRQAGKVIACLAHIPERFCLLCAEKKVSDCHRKLIADLLQAGGDRVIHLE